MTTIRRLAHPTERIGIHIDDQNATRFQVVVHDQEDPTLHTWILIADGSRATLFSRAIEPPLLHQVATWDNPDGRTPDHVSETDNLGSSRHGSSMTPETQPKRHAQQAFAKQLAAMLKERLADYNRLIVAAPPKFLGDLRKEFDDRIREKIAGELDKDLTHISAHDLPEHLDKLLETLLV